ncbi:MAG: rhomboid family intramembrane serine protease [Verrucomicrobiota bacterium]
MNRFNKAEQKYQRLAIPGILRMLAFFQLLVFILAYFQGEDNSFLEAISLNIGKVLSGEVWRLLTFIFIPRTFSLLWIVIAVLFMWFINDGLESAWGAFRLNAYVLGTVICTIIGSFVAYFLFQIPYFQVGNVIFHTAFLAFAVIYPNQVIQLMLVLPIKIKYVAMLDVAVIFLIIIGSPTNAIPFAFAFIPFAIFAGPIFLEYMKNSASTAERRARFQAAAQPESDSFHKCYACGVTEIDDPNLEFRVASDGEEYCLPCLQEKKAAEQSAQKNEN